ncbi:MAG: ATP phosphoribosyltransferase [Deltaproteobacteria bacterium]|nr:ATP phosphoribosyltransferase [Deltaproteobacteria bacterium]
MSAGPKPLTLAAPKGRLLQRLAPRLHACGFTQESLSDRDRRLIRESADQRLRLFLLKPDDVPTYVEHGAADVGIVGRDVLLERAADVLVPVDLKLGVCKLAVAAQNPEALRPPAGRALRVATKYPNIARAHFAARGEDVEVIFLGGSVELGPLANLADCIVDIVETGETLRSNGLFVYETVCEVSAVLIVNRVSMKLHRDAINALLATLSAG